MRGLLAGLILGCAAMLSSPASAAPYSVDKDHAQITFTADHLGFSTVHGQFRNWEAVVDFDPGNVEATQVAITIDATSIDTASALRDKSLRSKNFLNTATFPTITFRTTSVTPTGTDTATVTGDLTLIGVTKPVTMSAKLNKLGPSPFQKDQMIAGFTITGQIDRREFGMSFAAPAVSAIIPIRIDLEMSPSS
ncbi:MAG: YceI family protein [Pseudomonadota bacterium]